jgi:hypothetical protein
MRRGDSWQTVRKIIASRLRDGLARHGFSQYFSTNYFIRDRGAVRDVVFFQKMRSDAFCIAYGVSGVPSEGDEWTPGVKPSCWLGENQSQESFHCRYVEHAERSVDRALVLLSQLALPWFKQF